MLKSSLFTFACVAMLFAAGCGASTEPTVEATVDEAAQYNTPEGVDPNEGSQPSS